MTRRRPLLDSVSARLAAALVAVALGAIALLASLVVYAAAGNVADLADDEQAEATAAIAGAAGDAHSEAGGWRGADLDTALALGREAGGAVSVFDDGHRRIAGDAESGASDRVRSLPVTIDGRTVGRVEVAFASGGLRAPMRHLRDALMTTIAVAAGCATLLAVVVSVAVARRITRPLTSVTATVRAVEAGDRTARVGDVGARGELGELGEAFDRMADVLAQQEMSRRALVADVAHELRTPLTILRGTIEGLADGVVEATPPRLVALHDDVLRLTRVVEDLETLASADAAGLSLHVALVDLSAIAKDATDAFGPQYQAAGIDLSLRARPVVTRADPHRMHQVLANLLTNALKFTPAGGSVAVTVEAADDRALLGVADTGIGIPSEDHTRVFDRFWRGDEGNAVAGSGIGLTVVADLVGAQAGTIHLDSTPGQGTRVTVTLPRA